MDAMPICTHCGFTWGEYRSRGLLGCPHCYASFGEALQGDLLWIHAALGGFPDAASGQSGPGPGGGPATDSDSTPTGDPAAAAESGAAAGHAPERMARWREQLADAVRREDYEAATRLQKLIRGAAEGKSDDALG